MEKKVIVDENLIILWEKFKNPENEFVWKLIDGCELRGYRNGGIEISFKHPNFIVNVGNGTAKEFVEVTDMIKKQIKDKYNIDLNLEVELFNGRENWS